MASTTPAQSTLRAITPPDLSAQQGLLDRLHALDATLAELDSERSAFEKRHFEFCRAIGQCGRFVIRAESLKQAKAIDEQWRAFFPRRMRIERQRSKVLYELSLQKFPNLMEGR